jgi:hypothetical protein
MKRAIGLIAATLISTSIYSQDYSTSSSTSNPDSTPDYRGRQTESGAPSTSNTNNSAGYDRAPGLSGGNSSTGQSNGTNVGNTPEQDQSLTTRDSDLPGSEYRGTLQTEPERSFDFELNPSASGSSGSSVSGSSSSDETLKGSGSADGAFHDPASPVREGSQSEGWSGSGTFSGAGPGSVTGSQSSDSNQLDSSNGAALDERDRNLQERGLEPDGKQLGRDRSDQDNDSDVYIMEEWQVIRPDENVGAPPESESGTQNNSDEQYLDNRDHFDSTAKGSAGANVSGSMNSSESNYSRDLYKRVQRDWSERLHMDVPASPGTMDRTLEELNRTRYYNDSTESSFGAPGSSVSGSAKSDDDDCDRHKGSAPESEQGWNDRESDLDGSVRSSGSAIDSDQRFQESSGGPGASVSGSATGSESDSDRSLRSSGTAMDHDERLRRERDRYHINRGEDDKYHINREASGDRSESSAPGEYGDRPSGSNYDDGHLSGNNAASSSENSATTPE